MTTERQPNVLRRLWKPDPKRPVYSALLEAELQRIDKLFDGSINEKMRTVKNEQEAKMFANELVIFFKEGEEILDWIFPPRQTTFDQSLTIAKSMKDANLPMDMIQSYMKKAGSKPRGRPITKRQIAVKALEKQILEPERKWSYAQLAQQFCNCDKVKHDQNCAQSLRQTMIQLKKVLKKYASDPL